MHKKGSGELVLNLLKLKTIIETIVYYIVSMVD